MASLGGFTQRAQAMLLEAHIMSSRQGRDAPSQQDWQDAIAAVNKDFDAIDETYRLMSERTDRLIAQSARRDRAAMDALVICFIVGITTMIASLLSFGIC